jgi:translation initiation factor 5A
VGVTFIAIRPEVASKIQRSRVVSYKIAKVGDLKVGSYAIVDGEPSRIMSIQKSKSGKHGSAKYRCSAVSLFDGSKRSFVNPVDTSINIPIVEKNAAQIVSMTPDGLQLMDLETYEVFEVATPKDEEIVNKLAAGKEVEYWKIMGRYKVQRVKG